MSSQNNFSFDNFDFSRTPGECWVCHTPINSGLFCTECDGGKVKNEPAKKQVRDLKPGDEGYVHFLAIFVRDDIYYILMNALVKPEFEPGHFKIRVTNEFQYRIDIRYFGTTHIMDYDPDFEHVSFVRIYLENAGLFSVHDIELSPEDQDTMVVSTVNELEEWQTGYTVPWGFIACDGLLWIRKDCTVTTIPEGENTVKIRKSNGLIEVDSNTLPIQNLVDRSWPAQEPAFNFIMAILLKSLP